MRVEAIVNVSLTTNDVDRHGSIVAAVADQLMVDPSQLINLPDWVWQYESNREYTWADSRQTQPLTGEPFVEDEDDQS